MMYSEFIERTGYSETYMTYNDYTTYIEPVYMESGTIDKDKFCKDFYKAYRNNVQKIVEMLIVAKTTDELEEYIAGDESVIDDVQAVENTLKQAFLKTYAKREKGWFKRV